MLEALRILLLSRKSFGDLGVSSSIVSSVVDMRYIALYCCRYLAGVHLRCMNIMVVVVFAYAACKIMSRRNYGMYNRIKEYYYILRSIILFKFTFIRCFYLSQLLFFWTSNRAVLLVKTSTVRHS